MMSGFEDKPYFNMHDLEMTLTGHTGSNVTLAHKYILQVCIYTAMIQNFGPFCSTMTGFGETLF
jgi:hypothetical protein